MRRLLFCALCLSSAAAAFAQNDEDAKRWAASTLASLSLREKAAQMVCEPIRGDYASEDSEDFRHWSRLARELGIGGFVVYGGAPYETAHLLNRLQKEARLPLLISADFEGGPGQQFRGASEFPANMALAAIGDEKLAYEVGRVGALEGRVRIRPHLRVGRARRRRVLREHGLSGRVVLPHDPGELAVLCADWSEPHLHGLGRGCVEPVVPRRPSIVASRA